MAHWTSLRTRYGPRPGKPIRGRTKSRLRRARLVADGGGLENRYGGNLIVGSNPTPSAAQCPVTSKVTSQDIVRRSGAVVLPCLAELGAARRWGAHPEEDPLYGLAR